MSQASLLFHCVFATKDRSSATLWSAAYDGQLKPVLEDQRSIALNLGLSKRRNSKRNSDSPEDRLHFTRQRLAPAIKADAESGKPSGGLRRRLPLLRKPPGTSLTGARRPGG